MEKGFICNIFFAAIIALVRANCKNPNDTRCLATRNNILNIINNLRRQEGAANMKKITWNAAAASKAQAWANKCLGGHGMADGCGQNGGQGYKSWNDLFISWNSEKRVFKYGQNPCQSYKNIGHYTQNVWADTNSIGCAFAKCPNLVGGTHWVCNYCPAGNYSDKLCTPFLPGKGNGGVCGKCGGIKSPNCDRGLCK